MTVEENIGCGLKAGKKEKAIRISQMVELLHLQELEKRYPMQLSGGQQQRVALARILAYEPDVLMLDEPFSALDAYLKENLQQELIETLNQYHGDTLIVSHNRDEVYSLCDKISIIENGKLALTGDTKEIFHKPTKLVAARLTGCKNISTAKKISDFQVEATEWGIILNTSEKVPDNIKYLGIRAHDIRIARDEKEENAAPCKLIRMVETPFEKNLICESNSKEIWWKVSNAYWTTNLENNIPSYITFPKDSLMLLE